MRSFRAANLPITAYEQAQLAPSGPPEAWSRQFFARSVMPEQPRTITHLSGYPTNQELRSILNRRRATSALG